MASSGATFEVKACEVRYYGPHATIAGRVTGVVRVHHRRALHGQCHQAITSTSR